jgi:outer membrane protein assembly factor BamA
VKRVSIHGADKVPPTKIMRYLHLQPSRLFGTQHYYFPGIETSDRERILELYEAYGYYDTRVKPIPVVIRRKDRKMRRQVVDISIDIVEGQSTIVDAVKWTWEPSIDHGAPIERQSIEKEARLREGANFSIVALNHDVAAVHNTLQEDGFAFAKIDEVADVNRDTHRASVSFHVQPGERFKVSRIEVEGLLRVHEELVRREIADAIGRTYSPTLLKEIESTVYDLQVFSTVSVSVGEPEASGHLPLVVHVREQRMQQVGAGVLLDIDPLRWSQRLGFRYHHLNLFRQLVRFDTNLLAGWAELPNPFQSLANGPRVEFTTRFAKRGWLGRKLIWTLEPKIEIDIREGYQFWGIQNRLGVSRFLGRHALVGLSYNNRYVDFFHFTPGFRSVLRLLEVLVHDPYISSYLEAQAEIFSLDNLVTPTQGARFIFNYQFANRFLGSNFDYHRFQPELRLYLLPHSRIQLGARARIGFIVPYASSTTAPFDQKYYLGGANDVRGWPLRRISPYARICASDDPERCVSIPIGGNTEVLGNLEARWRAVGKLWIAGFVDVGDVQANVGRIRTSDWNVSAGGGLRYQTPLGPIRLDIGFRLNRDERRYPDAKMWALHISLGEVF